MWFKPVLLMVAFHGVQVLSQYTLVGVNSDCKAEHHHPRAISVTNMHTRSTGVLGDLLLPNLCSIIPA